MLAYRPEVDGLRAIAILSVILFHAGVYGVSGGYVGVDIFFVISGYLITAIIAKEVSTGEFSIVNFWERRVRRILPALFFVLALTVLSAWFILLPVELDDFFDSLIAVSLSISNMFFWKTSGYFDTASELKPLLHTWSLAVEEQFYLGFPALLLLIWRFGRAAILWVVVAIATVSLLLAQIGSTSHPDATFYLIPTRAWELMIGALVALHRVTTTPRTPHRLISGGGSLLGMLLMFVAILGFDANIPFPSVYGLIPTVGAALVILYANPHNLVGKLLANRLCVGIGLLSYSAYLWHQPLFTFARHLSVSETSVLLLVGQGFVSFVLAYFSWRYIEGPFREKGRFSRKQVFSFGGVGTALFIAIGVVGSQADGAPWRFEGTERTLIRFASADYTEDLYNEGYRMTRCFLEPEQAGDAFAQECLARGAPLLWGDSHGAALSSGFAHSNLTQFTASGCPPLLNQEFAGRHNCRNANDSTLASLIEADPAIVMLHANWSMYAPEQVRAGLLATVAAIQEQLPGKSVVIVGGVPHWGLSGLPTRLVRLAQQKTEVVTNMSIAAEVNKVRAQDQFIAELFDGYPHVTFKSSLDVLCPEGGSNCLATVAGSELIPTAWDYGHLTDIGARFLVEQLNLDAGDQPSGETHD